MTIAACSRYQKNANFWAWFFLMTTVLSLSALMLDSETGLLIGIVGSILSLTFCLSALIFKRYYALYEKAFVVFQELPALASWTIPEGDWSTYQLVEKEHRTRSYFKYILWSPVLVAAIAIMIWAEIDDLSFDINLIWWGLFGYTFMMAILYFQMRVGLNKTSHTGDHVIQLKTIGAQIDDSITYWGKFVADTHATRGQALGALLFAKTDKDSKVNKAYVHQEKGYQYLVINFSLTEDHSSDLFLPIPNDVASTIEDKLSQLQSTFYASEPEGASGKKHNTQKYLKWIMGGAIVISAAVWFFEQGLPLYYQWQAEKLFDEGSALQDSGNVEAALGKYRAAINQSDEMPEPFLNIGVIYLNAGQQDSAIYYFDKALEVKPEYDLALLNKATVYYNQEDYPKTITTLLNYETVVPEKHDHDLLMGDSYYNLQKVDTALFYYQRAYSENKKSAALCYLLGDITLGKLDPDKAVPYFEESIALDSSFVDSYISLGKIYESANEPDKANLYFSKAEQFKKE